MKKIALFFLSIAGLLLPHKSSAQLQISDSLFKDLWPEVRPQNRTSITDKEAAALLS